MQFTVKRSKWLHNEGWVCSLLLRSDDGKMCCLGFLTKELGYLDEEISNKGVLSDLNNHKKLPESFLSLKSHEESSYVDDSDSIKEIMRINDNDENFYHINDNEMEQLLIEKFAKLDIELSFED